MCFAYTIVDEARNDSKELKLWFLKPLSAVRMASRDVVRGPAKRERYVPLRESR